MEIVNKIYVAEKKVFAQSQKEMAVELEKVEQYPFFVGPQELRQKYLDEMKIYQAIAKELGAL